MKLFDVAGPEHHFSVWAVFNEEGSCQVMEKMRRVSREHQELAQQMAAMLYEEVPDKGPPNDSRRFGSLREGVVYEFKAQEYVTRTERLGFRIACFFDGAFTIVCTNAFYKTGTTPRDQVNLAVGERERYFRDKELDKLDLIDWPGGQDHD
ncbi:MAG TPA: hypothetical protein VOA80_02370 [Thermoanaerobaculia bacterium]|nr:hypothetical protein [Thermoanaerobaculia bacterium]